MPAKKKPAKKQPAKKKPAAKKKTAAKKTSAPKKVAKKAKAAVQKAAKKVKAVVKKAVAQVKAVAKPAAKPAAAKPAAAKPAAAPARPSLEGQPAPHFTLAGDDGKTHSLLEHRGQPVVLYFYPKDDTPGCTVEACDFRDNIARATGKGAVVYGVSKDSLGSHEKFKNKYNLNFTLLSDTDLGTHRAYGAWGEKMLYGQPTIGVIRSTFLIDREGVVRRAWPRVKVEGHVDEVLKALEAL